jgi:hypothetical protein
VRGHEYIRQGRRFEPFSDVPNKGRSCVLPLLRWLVRFLNDELLHQWEEIRHTRSVRRMLPSAKRESLPISACRARRSSGGECGVSLIFELEILSTDMDQGLV